MSRHAEEVTHFVCNGCGAASNMQGSPGPMVSPSAWATVVVRPPRAGKAYTEHFCSPCWERGARVGREDT